MNDRQHQEPTQEKAQPTRSDDTTPAPPPTTPPPGPGLGSGNATGGEEKDEGGG